MGLLPLTLLCDYGFRLLALNQQVLTDGSLPDELLFGRSGYLLALLFVRHHLGTESVSQTVVRQVSIGTDLGSVFSQCSVQAVSCYVSLHSTNVCPHLIYLPWVEIPVPPNLATRAKF